MKISVIIPTYKPRAYLWECLDSLVAQTFSKDDFEVLLVHDGSNDKTLQIMQEVREKDKRINYLNLSRNFGK